MGHTVYDPMRLKCPEKAHLSMQRAAERLLVGAGNDWEWAAGV